MLLVLSSFLMMSSWSLPGKLPSLGYTLKTAMSAQSSPLSVSLTNTWCHSDNGTCFAKSSTETAAGSPSSTFVLVGQRPERDLRSGIPVLGWLSQT